mmetsp:Transcript_24039/g.47195  ORF Transcript_24039/g.47195 Transcript_24039/m.47195 type:complete len:255 (-) Transcript_24039:68-832(-)
MGDHTDKLLTTLKLLLPAINLILCQLRRDPPGSTESPPWLHSCNHISRTKMSTPHFLHVKTGLVHQAQNVAIVETPKFFGMFNGFLVQIIRDCWDHCLTVLKKKEFSILLEDPPHLSEGLYWLLIRTYAECVYNTVESLVWKLRHLQTIGDDQSERDGVYFGFLLFCHFKHGTGEVCTRYRFYFWKQVVVKISSCADCHFKNVSPCFLNQPPSPSLNSIERLIDINNVVVHSREFVECVSSLFLCRRTLLVRLS